MAGEEPESRKMERIELNSHRHVNWVDEVEELQGRKSMSWSHGQELGQKALKWLHKSEQPIRSQGAKLLSCSQGQL